MPDVKRLAFVPVTSRVNLSKLTEIPGLDRVAS